MPVILSDFGSSSGLQQAGPQHVGAALPCAMGGIVLIDCSVLFLFCIALPVHSSTRTLAPRYGHIYIYIYRIMHTYIYTYNYIYIYIYTYTYMTKHIYIKIKKIYISINISIIDLNILLICAH